MTDLKGKIDFTLFVSVRNANPNGDPLNGNRPRTDLDGNGEISDVCIKRKIRNRLQDMGQRILIQSNDRADDEYKSIKSRIDGCEKLKEAADDRKKYAEIVCKEWIDVRTFGQVFAFSNDKKGKKKGNKAENEEDSESKSVSIGVRGPVSIHQAVSLSPVEVISMQITKSVNGESDEGRASDTMGTKYFIPFAVYKIMGSVNVQLAEKTGFSQEDAELLKKALETLFENDASSARPEGSIEVCRMYWWQHNEKTPAVSSGKIQKGFTMKDVADPKDFEDYGIEWYVDGCDKPEVIDFV